MEPDKDIRKLNDFIGEQLTIHDAYNPEELIAALTELVDEMLKTDFERLINILYRLDISESKLKKELVTCPKEQSAGIIARLIIEREVEKRKTRQNFYRADDIPEEDKW